MKFPKFYKINYKELYKGGNLLLPPFCAFKEAVDRYTSNKTFSTNKIYKVKKPI